MGNATTSLHCQVVRINSGSLGNCSQGRHGGLANGTVATASQSIESIKQNLLLVSEAMVGFTSIIVLLGTVGPTPQ